MTHILYFDSLKNCKDDLRAGGNKEIHGNLLNWLNNQWKDAKQTTDEPFNENSCPMLSPNGMLFLLFVTAKILSR